MFKKIIIYLLLIFSLVIGLLSLYRASLKSSDMTIVNGRVTNKIISYYTSYHTGRHYSLIFTLRDRQNKIAINLGTENEAREDATFYLIDTSKLYKFFIDPTIPVVNGVQTGITRIDYNDQTIFKSSNNLNLYGGLCISLLSIAGLILIKYKKTATNVNCVKNLLR